MQFLGLREAARRSGRGHATLHRWCRQHAGFALWADQHWRIPADHVTRVLDGELPSQIGRNPSVPVGDAAGAENDIAHAKVKLVQSYFAILAARHHAGEISDHSHDRLLGALASNILDAMKALRVIEPGGLRAAISECDAAAEFRALTGIRPLF